MSQTSHFNPQHRYDTSGSSDSERDDSDYKAPDTDSDDSESGQGRSAYVKKKRGPAPASAQAKKTRHSADARAQNGKPSGDAGKGKHRGNSASIPAAHKAVGCTRKSLPGLLKDAFKKVYGESIAGLTRTGSVHVQNTKPGEFLLEYYSLICQDTVPGREREIDLGFAKVLRLCMSKIPHIVHEISPTLNSILAKYKDDIGFASDVFDGKSAANAYDAFNGRFSQAGIMPQLEGKYVSAGRLAQESFHVVGKKFFVTSRCRPMAPPAQNGGASSASIPSPPLPAAQHAQGPVADALHRAPPGYDMERDHLGITAQGSDAEVTARRDALETASVPNDVMAPSLADKSNCGLNFLAGMATEVMFPDLLPPWRGI
jgi:hypothetical protein